MAVFAISNTLGRRIAHFFYMITYFQVHTCLQMLDIARSLPSSCWFFNAGLFRCWSFFSEIIFISKKAPYVTGHSIELPHLCTCYALRGPMYSSCRPDHLSTLRIQFSIQGETGNIAYLQKDRSLKKTTWILYLNSNSGSFDATHGGKILIPTLSHLCPWT